MRNAKDKMADVQVAVADNFAVVGESRVHRHGDQLFVAALVILHQKHANRADLDDCAWNDWRTGDHQRI